MARVLLIFGSKSNSDLYKSLARKLKSAGIPFDLRICSAHKTQGMLNAILKKNYKLIIAGAGLSAALPGVVASKVLAPVIGLPASDNFRGLDALLSVMQMPSGVAVLSVGVDAVSEVAIAAKKIMKQKMKIVLIGGKGSAERKAISSAAKTLEKLKVKFSVERKIGNDKKAVYLQALPLGKKPAKTNSLAIYIPVASVKSNDSGKLLTQTKSGLWVGLNNGNNAALAALQLTGNFSVLKKARNAAAKKVSDADKEKRKKYA